MDAKIGKGRVDRSGSGVIWKEPGGWYDGSNHSIKVVRPSCRLHDAGGTADLFTIARQDEVSNEIQIKVLAAGAEYLKDQLCKGCGACIPKLTLNVEPLLIMDANLFTVTAEEGPVKPIRTFF